MQSTRSSSDLICNVVDRLIGSIDRQAVNQHDNCSAPKGEGYSQCMQRHARVDASYTVRTLLTPLHLRV